MKNRIATLILALACVSLSGCIYANVKTPFDSDVSTTKLGSKVGEAEWQSVLGLFAWGDAGTAAAAKNGNITTINHLDQQYFAILGFVYARHTIIAYGD